MSRSNKERAPRIEPREELARHARIRDPNDQFRTSFTGGRVMITSGVRGLGPLSIHHVVHAVRTFTAFDDGNDPYGEHDMGCVDLLGECILWKIDYYDHRFEYGSPDPSLPALTGRVLTVMLASEYRGWGAAYNSKKPRRLTPLRRGDLDGLCGIYAVVHAIRLVVHPFFPLRQPQLKRLFDCGLGTLSKSRMLRRSITEGMSANVWLQVCDDMVFEAAAITGLEMFASPLFGSAPVPTDSEALRVVRRNLRKGWPVLVALMDSYNHTSVIVGHGTEKGRSGPDECYSEDRSSRRRDDQTALRRFTGGWDYASRCSA